MKKALNVRLSLRKLLVATLALGPLAVLPGPVWAVLPTAGTYTTTSGPTGASFTVTNGTVVVTNSPPAPSTPILSNLQASDRAVLVWGNNTIATVGLGPDPAGSTITNFNIETGQTYNFSNNGSVLNRVRMGNTTAATGNATYAGIAAYIAGTLQSSGKVYILSDAGDISITGGAIISTTNGLVLSTINESSSIFTSLGDLAFQGTSTGNITIGAATVSGDLTAVGGDIDGSPTSVSGNLVLRSVTAGEAIELGATAVTGNLTVTTNNAAVTQTGAVTVGFGVSGNQRASFTTGTGGVTLSDAANDFEIVTLQTTSATGDVDLEDSNIITLGASSIGGDLLVTAAGTATKTAIATSGAVSVGGTASFTSTVGDSGINFANGSSVAGVVTATTANSAITINVVGDLDTGVINAGAGTKAAVALTTNAVLTTGGAITATDAAAGPTTKLTGARIDQTVGAITNTGVVTYSATAGNLTIGAVTANTVSATATGGRIAQAPGTIITTNLTTGVSALSATGNITLTEANALADGSAVTITSGGSASLTNTAAVGVLNDLVLGTTDVTGNLTLTMNGGDLQLGRLSGVLGQDIKVGGVLDVNGAGAITDNNYSEFDIFGGLDLAGTSVELDAANTEVARFGRVNIAVGGGAALIRETTTLNLGTITAASLNARSLEGGIIDSGNLALTGLARLQVPSTGTIVLDGSNNVVGSVAVVGGNNNSLNFNSALTLAAATNVTGALTVSTTAGNGITLAGGSVKGSLNVNSGGTIELTTGTTSVTGNASLTAAGAITDTAPGVLSVTGTTTLASEAGITLDGANEFNTVVLNNSTGAVTINDITDLTVSGSAGGLLTATAGGAGAVPGPWALTLGNLTLGSLAATAANGGGGKSGTLTQKTGTKIHTTNAASFTTTNANIVIGNNGNNFGRLSANAGSSTVRIVEDGFMRLGDIAGGGASSLTSNFGSIIEGTAAVGNGTDVTNNGTLTLNAPAGSVMLGTTGVTTGNIAAVVANVPAGAFNLRTTVAGANLALGNVTALSANVTVAGGNITQASGATVRVFGGSRFEARDNITLGNAGNNFGRVALQTNTASRSITIREAGTLNLGTVSMPAGSTGSFAATSDAGDIIDTGLAGVKPGGTVATIGSGIVTLNATSGNITLDDPTTDFPTSGGVAFNANNVVLSPLGLGATTATPLTLYLGSATVPSKVTGNLTVTSPIGHIGNAGPIEVAGNAVFQTGTGNITLTQTGNRFGTVRFSGNEVRIKQINDMNLVPGSQAIGLAEFESNEYITIAEGSGVVTLNSTGNFTATGSIILPKRIQAAGTLTVNSPSLKDLNALSVSGDLGGKNPINLGTGPYDDPQP